MNEVFEKKKKEYWITNSRWKLIVIILVLFWVGIMVLLYLKADEVTKDPCGICAKKMGEEVICYTGTSEKSIKTYYPNGSVDYEIPNSKANFPLEFGGE